MNVEIELQKLIARVNNLQNAFVQSQRNQAPITAKVDTTSSEVKAITPYTETKTAYIGDTEVIFKDIKDGNLSVYVKDDNGDYPDYAIERTNDVLTVYFEPLEYITTITISIQ